MASDSGNESPTLFFGSAAVAGGKRGLRGKWWLVTWLAALAICVGASLIWTPNESTATQGSVPITADESQAPVERTEPRVSSRLGGSVTDDSRSITMLLPREHDYLSSVTIPIAGLAIGRPHGPQVRTVHVELWVNGRVVGQTDLPVYSGRFAGILEITVDVPAGRAELRVTDPARPGMAPVVRWLTLAAT
jgi:hypothetical protein